MIFLPRLAKFSTSGIAILDVTTQSDIAFTSALVLAYTTISRSGYLSQKFLKSSTPQLSSREQVASLSKTYIFFSGLSIFAVSPMNLTPAIIRFFSVCSVPNLAI